MSASYSAAQTDLANDLDGQDSAADGKLPTGRLIAHSLFHVNITGPHMPIAVYLPAIYAQQFGISLTVLGMIFLAERVWGTLTDPLVGWLCDKTRCSFGRRKAWLIAGTVLLMVTCGLLFFPLPHVTPTYLIITLVLLFLAMSMVQIPYYAWSGELSGHYHERTRITSYQTVASSVALFVVLLTPAMIDAVSPGDQMMKLHGMGAAILLPALPTLLLALWAFPDRSTGPAVRHGDHLARPPKVPLRQALATIWAEKVLLRIMLADFAITFAQGMRGALFVFFVSFVAGKPEWASGLFLFQFIIGVFAAPIWQQIAQRIGKHQALFWAEIGQAAVNLLLIFVGFGDVVLLVTLTAMQGLMQGTGNMLLRSMLADIADEHQLRTGVNRTAMLFSIFSISGKAGLALPIGIALPVIAWFGFDPQLPTNSSTALTAVAVVFAFGTGFAHLLGAWLVKGFHIDEGRQAEIQHALQSREAP